MKSKLCPQGQPEVFTLQPHEIAFNWSWIEPFLSRVEEADWVPADVKEALVTAQAQLWGAHDGERVLGIWITRIENIGARKRGLLWVAAGNPLDVGLQLYHEFTEPWLKQQGCEYAQIVGRKGWKRVLPEYREAGVILEKVL